MNKALIIIDMQNDFLPGGSLAVENADQLIPTINQKSKTYNTVIATQDWHPSNHKSFASQHSGKNVFDTIDLNGTNQVLWPNHCIQGTLGAEISKKINLNCVEAIFRKGTNPNIDSYSAFYDNGHLKSTGLTGYLKEKNITHVDFCGVAADYCVYYSIKDALKEGFKVGLLQDATLPIDNLQYQKQRESLSNQITII